MTVDQLDVVGLTDTSEVNGICLPPHLWYALIPDMGKGSIGQRVLRLYFMQSVDALDSVFELASVLIAKAGWDIRRAAHLCRDSRQGIATDQAVKVIWASIWKGLCTSVRSFCVQHFRLWKQKSSHLRCFMSFWASSRLYEPRRLPIWKLCAVIPSKSHADVHSAYQVGHDPVWSQFLHLLLWRFSVIFP